VKSIYYKIFNRLPYKKNKLNTIYVDYEDDITDEIEKSLWEIKNNLDLPTEEIDNAILSRANYKKKELK
jgi:hypothetical protein